MDYKNKYKNALRWIESIYPTLQHEQQMEAEGVFPELAESEDERIRKELIKETKGSEMRLFEIVSNDEFVAWLEKLSEQKLTDNVEPKFKVGDWLQYRSAEPFLVEEITEQGYTNGNSCLPFEWENETHLWTIQDAKEGDVLACNEEILLFKSFSVQGRISLYCWYNGQTKNFHSKEVDNTSLTTRNKIFPATKEQRDTLFAKMKEAGYEWNADKKELKKIEQKSAWSEDDEIGLDDALWCCKQAASIAKDENDMGNAWYAENWLKSIKDRIGSGLICTVKDDESTDEQKPADKVKPKFKAGDWIVDNRTGVVHYIAKIKGTVDGCYYVLGYDKGLLHVNNETDYHLWTVADAKDGDVLVDICGNIGIYLRHIGFGWRSYCSFGRHVGFHTFIVNHEIEGTHPATPTQRDLLFQKMKEDGYMWDSHAKMLICSADMKSK